MKYLNGPHFCGVQAFVIQWLQKRQKEECTVLQYPAQLVTASHMRNTEFDFSEHGSAQPAVVFNLTELNLENMLRQIAPYPTCLLCTEETSPLIGFGLRASQIQKYFTIKLDGFLPSLTKTCLKRLALTIFRRNSSRAQVLFPIVKHKAYYTGKIMEPSFGTLFKQQ